MCTFPSEAVRLQLCGPIRLPLPSIFFSFFKSHNPRHEVRATFLQGLVSDTGTVVRIEYVTSISTAFVGSAG